MRPKKAYLELCLCACEHDYSKMKVDTEINFNVLCPSHKNCRSVSILGPNPSNGSMFVFLSVLCGRDRFIKFDIL